MKNATLAQQLPNEIIMKIIKLATFDPDAARDYHTSRVEWKYGLKVWAHAWRKKKGKVIQIPKYRCRHNPLKSVIQELGDFQRQAHRIHTIVREFSSLPDVTTSCDSYGEILLEISKHNRRGVDTTDAFYIDEYLEYLLD